MNRERTCIGCRKKGSKESMVRVYRSPEGFVCADIRGKGPGRGAYVCSIECFERAKDEKRFASALRTKVEGGALEAMAGEVAEALAMLDAEGKE